METVYNTLQKVMIGLFGGRDNTLYGTENRLHILFRGIRKCRAKNIRVIFTCMISRVSATTFRD